MSVPKWEAGWDHVTVMLCVSGLHLEVQEDLPYHCSGSSCLFECAVQGQASQIQMVNGVAEGKNEIKMEEVWSRLRLISAAFRVYIMMTFDRKRSYCCCTTCATGITWWPSTENDPVMEVDEKQIQCEKSTETSTRTTVHQGTLFGLDSNSTKKCLRMKAAPRALLLSWPP